MASVKIYLDEDVHTFIAHALRLRGHEALTTAEAQRRGANDQAQITFATNSGYAIVSYNVRDFPRLHYEMTSNGRTHMGIIVGVRDDPRRNVRALFRLLDKVSAEAMREHLVYLNNWA